MKFTVQYIPLSQIRADRTAKKLTKPLKILKQVLWDCTHLIAVRKDKLQNKYTVISGFSRYEYLRETNQTHVPCLIDQTEDTSHAANQKTGSRFGAITLLWRRLRNKQLVHLFPQAKLQQMEPGSLSIFRHFLKQEPRFKKLSRVQQVKVLYLGIRYRRTVIHSMKRKVDEFSSK